MEAPAVVTTESVMTMAKQMLRLSDTTDNDIFLEALIVEGCRRLSTNETLIIKNCTVTANNSRFYLPKGCKQILAFRGSDSCIPGIMVDLNFFKQCGCNFTSFQNVGSLGNLLDIQGRWAYFIAAVPDGTEFEIAYQSLNDDENGIMIVNEEAAIALQNYAAWKFALSYPENYSRAQWLDWKTDYMFQANRCRGLAARRKFEQAREQIKAKINQIVNTSAPIGLLYGTYNSFLYPTITTI